jgi:hypothetical protein
MEGPLREARGERGCMAPGGGGTFPFSRYSRKIRRGHGACVDLNDTSNSFLIPSRLMAESRIMVLVPPVLPSVESSLGLG